MEEKKVCSRETEVYSRVVGFYRPTKLWNKGKKEEFKKRVEFSLKKADENVNQASFAQGNVQIG